MFIYIYIYIYIYTYIYINIYIHIYGHLGYLCYVLCLMFSVHRGTRIRLVYNIENIYIVYIG